MAVDLYKHTIAVRIVHKIDEGRREHVHWHRIAIVVDKCDDVLVLAVLCRGFKIPDMHDGTGICVANYFKGVVAFAAFQNVAVDF